MIITNRADGSLLFSFLPSWDSVKKGISKQRLDQRKCLRLNFDVLLIEGSIIKSLIELRSGFSLMLHIGLDAFLHFAIFVALNHVADLHVVETIDAHTAVEA